MSRGRALAKGSAWTSAAQISLVLLQLAYTAFMSRMIQPTSFGTYAIVLTGTNLVALLCVGGVGQGAARLRRDEEDEVGAVALLSLLAGLAAGVIALVAFGVASFVGGSFELLCTIALSSVSAIFSPVMAAQAGILRREGAFRLLAGVSIVATFFGFSASAAFAIWTQNAVALAVAPALLSVLSVVCFQSILRERFMPSRRGTLATHAFFSVQVSLANSLSFLMENLPRLAIGGWLGVSTLGYWNRSEAITTVPFDKVQASVRSVVYPELRGSGVRADDQRRWRDLLRLTLWIFLPLSCYLAGAMPIVVPFVLGRQWEAMVPMAIALAISAGLRGVPVQFASALESVAGFRVIWLSNLAALVFQVGAFLVVIVTTSWTILAGSVVLLPVVWHISQIIAARHAGFLPRGTVRGYVAPILVGVSAVVLSTLCIRLWMLNRADYFFGFFVLSTGFLLLMLLVWMLRRVLGLQPLLDRYLRR
ncbi:oligosaccharide flippase family protein [Sinomonas atrocyanea]